MGLESCYLFSRLRKEELAELQKISALKTYPEGSILFYAGDMPDKLRLVVSGTVQIVKHDASGNEIVLGELHANDLVAEMAHFEAIAYPATARCGTEVALYEIDSAAFMGRFMNRPELAMGIVRSLTRKIKQLEEVIRRSLIDDARTRLACYLLENADALAEMTQKQIASKIALTPETVSRILRTFKEKGLVEVRAKKIVLLDRQGLERLCGQTP